MNFIFFFVFVCISFYFLNQENKSFLKSLSYTLIKTQKNNIRHREFREIAEHLSQDFYNTSLLIKEGQESLFHYENNGFLKTCAKSTLENGFERKLTLEVCKNLGQGLSFLGFLFLAFALAILTIIAFALKAEESSKRSLVLFMEEVGMTFEKNTNFSKVLSRLEDMKLQFIALRTKLTIAAKETTKTQMASYLAHDLRSPLLVFEEILSSTNPSQFLELKPRIKASIQKIYRMVDGLNDKSKTPVVKKSIPSNFFHSLICEMDLIAKHKSKKLHVGIDLPTGIYLDQDKIERALSNLLVNAIEFSRKHIFLKIEVRTNKIYFLVIDDGKGVPEDFEELIYKENFTFGHSKGTGLGLSYVSKVVAAHEGSLRHYHEDEKTHFEMVIPIQESSKKLQKSASKIFVVLENENLFNDFHRYVKDPNWIFKKDFPSQEELKECFILYTDLAHAVRQTRKLPIKIILANADRDLPHTTYMRLTKILDHCEKT